MEDFGQVCEMRLIQELSNGNNGKLNGDNLDIRVTTNDLRLNNRDRYLHFFASDFVIDRVNVNNMCVNANANPSYTVQNFLPNDEEITAYKERLKILLGRDILHHMSQFQWMKHCIPTNIPHDLSDVMSKKSSIHLLPASLSNETSYSGCLKILDEYREMANRWYTKAGRGDELDHISIPIGGDQLTRVRLQGAKSLRAGAHTKQQRFEHLYPVVTEMFHTLQDFLEKMCKNLLKVSNGKDAGTLGNLRILIERNNVNGHVKQRFKAHGDFIITCGQAYFLSFVMEKFQMKDLDSKPSHVLLPENVKMLHQTSKEKVFSEVMDDIVSSIFEPFKLQPTPSSVQLSIRVGDQLVTISSPVENGCVQVSLLLNGQVTHLKVPNADLKIGVNLTIPCLRDTLFIQDITVPDVEDDLHNYVFQFMQWYFVVIQMKDSVREGVIYRTNIVLKTMIPFFYSHSYLSKYLTECIDYILKTEIILPPDLALKVRAASFVNPFGGVGKNKAADLHKENQMKALKNLIKGLGANKTEKSIVAVTKAAPTIDNIVHNFDSMVNESTYKTTHKCRSRESDIQCLLKKLQEWTPWLQQENRILKVFSNIKKSPFNFDKQKFTQHLLFTANRLERDLPNLDEEESSSSDEE